MIYEARGGVLFGITGHNRGAYRVLCVACARGMKGKKLRKGDKYLERVLRLVLLPALLLHVLAVHVGAGGVVDQGELEQRAEHERQTHAGPHVNSLQIALALPLQ